MADLMPPWASYEPEKDVWTLHIHAQPGAKFNEIIGEHSGRLKLKIAAPAVDNKANLALIQYIAGLAGVSTGKIGISRGEHARQKTLTIEGAGRNFLHLLQQQQKPGKP